MSTNPEIALRLEDTQDVAVSEGLPKGKGAKQQAGRNSMYLPDDQGNP